MNPKTKRSVNFTVIGAGEGGGRIADAFARLGYQAGAVNTAQVDLNGLRTIPTSNRLKVGKGIGGAGQDMKIGQEMIMEDYSKVLEFVVSLTSKADYLLLTIGGGGGTGSGAFEPLVRIGNESGIPIAVILTLPNSWEAVNVKANAVNVLRNAHRMVQQGMIRPLVLVDNERIGELWPGLTVANYWATANREIVEAWDVFNRLSTRDSEAFSSVDGADYARLLSIGGYAAMGFSIIDGYHENAIAGAMRQNVHSGLLANGFNLATAKAAAAIVSGSKAAIERLPMQHLMEGFVTLQQLAGVGTLFRGAYIDRGQKAKVYTLLTGLAAPQDRVGELVQDTRHEWQAFQDKFQESGDDLFSGLDFLESSSPSGTHNVFRALAKGKKQS